MPDMVCIPDILLFIGINCHSIHSMQHPDPIKRTDSVARKKRFAVLDTYGCLYSILSNATFYQ